MKNYYVHIEYLLKRLILLLIIFSISRIYFYIINFQHFQSISIPELIKIFLVGIRFDIAAIIAFNFLFIIFHLIPGYFKNRNSYQLFLKIIFIGINAIILLSNFIDSKYFSFINKRTTADIFPYLFISDDVYNVLPQLFHDYWYIILSWIICCAGLWYFYPKIKKDISPAIISVKNIFSQLMISVLILGILFIGFRGVRLKPLRIITAARYTPAQNIALVLNTPFSILKTINQQELKARDYYSEDKLNLIFNPVQNSKVNNDYSRPNVIIIILESFSKEYIGSLNSNQGYTPFLDSLIKKSLVFTNAYANGKRSIEAMPSIIAGLPTLMENSFISSSFSANNINSLASLLKRTGYHTSFFHGGANGTMGFDQFAAITGIEEYYGRNEYNNEDDFDGNWGIFDEEFLKYFADKINSFNSPFFSCVFTLSSHHPYTIPEKYKNRFEDGTLEIHRGIRYTDFALQKFFNYISHDEWFSNTLFIITADHTAQAYSEFYKNSIGMYSVPMIYYHPGDTSLFGYNKTITQHIDIMPSVLDYINYQESYIAFGNSVFDKSSNSFAINYLNGIYQLIENNYVLFFNGERSLSLFNLTNDSLLLNNLVNEEISIKEKLETRIKAIIQSYNYRMINNELIFP